MPLMILLLLLLPQPQRVVRVEQVPVGMWYAAAEGAGIELFRADFDAIRQAGFDSITIPVIWKDVEPKRNAFSFFGTERLIAAAGAAGLRVRAKMMTDLPPPWVSSTDAALEFLDYARRRLLLHAAVISVEAARSSDVQDRIQVGSGPNAFAQARLRMWTAIAQGQRSVTFDDGANGRSAAARALGELAGVITRNQSLFGPLRPREGAAQAVVQGAGGVGVRILESTEAIVIVAFNSTAEVQKVTLRFPPDIPEAIWQNIEEGVSVNFVMDKDGPFHTHTFAPHDVLVLTIRKMLAPPSPFAAIARDARGRVGAALKLIETGEEMVLNPDDRYPMQSVYKLPIGMAVFEMIDRKQLALEQRIEIAPAEFVSAGQYSPIRDRFPGGTTLTVAQLLQYTLAESDGTGSDVLLRLAGGPDGVMRFLAGIGVTGVHVVTTEKAMGLGDQSVQYRNWATPRGMVGLLEAVQAGRGLSPSSRSHLLKLMTQVSRGAGRIKGLLPPGTAVARRTGSSGTHGGVTAATNDVGIVRLPDGRHMAIAVFVSDSGADNAVRERVIARIARAGWDRWISK
jgi:beta-lactamase class A